MPTSAPKRTLPECFALFDLIHSITTTHAAIQRIVTEVIEDFEADGCVYLELRTTPKARPECSMTKRSYMHAVMSGIADFYENKGSCTGGEPSIDVQLLLSINRSESSIEAMDTVELALELSAEEGSRVVGVDLGGNPAVGCWEHWLGALEKARAGGLGVTLHCAEVWNEDESAKMVAWRPGRLGHMCCMGQALTQQLLASQVPVEICLSSNWVTGSVDSYDAHHFRDLYSKGNVPEPRVTKR